jgi:hypothetical protein
MKPMRLTIAIILVTILSGLATAEPSGLSGAIERQRQDVTTQQGQLRREMEQQRGSLQQQQERNLQFQLQQRQQQPVPPPAPSHCAQIAGALVCQ